jgi:hypothetical protein
MDDRKEECALFGRYPNILPAQIMLVAVLQTPWIFPCCSFFLSFRDLSNAIMNSK